MPNNRKFLKLSQRIKRKLLSGEQQPKAELPYFLKLPKSNCGQRSIKFYFHRYFMVLNHSWNNSWNSEKMCLRLGQGSSRFVVLCLKLNFHNCVTSSLPLLLPLHCSRVHLTNTTFPRIGKTCPARIVRGTVHRAYAWNDDNASTGGWRLTTTNFLFSDRIEWQETGFHAKF